MIIRRPAVFEAIECLDLDRRAVRRVQQLEETYGPGPLRLQVPGRTLAIVLDAADAHRGLRETPDLFAPGAREKRAALAPFQPHGVLVSPPEDRADRRRFNEAVLDSDTPLHQHAGRIQTVIVEEAQSLAATAHGQDGRLAWDGFIEAWYRIVRRIVLGDAARDDHAATDLLAELRASGNWAMLGRRRRRTRRRFVRQLQGHLGRADPGSLAQLIDRTPADDTPPTEQVPQWLFAHDAGSRWRPVTISWAR